MTDQPEALRLAGELEYGCPFKESVERSAATELRRLHAENERLTAALAAAPAEAEPAPTEFCWLVELFDPKTDNSLGCYHTGFTDLADQSRSTKDPLKAQRYGSKEAASRAAFRLKFNKVGVWRAVEHGFMARAATPAAPQDEREAFEKLIPHIGGMTHFHIFQAGAEHARAALAATPAAADRVPMPTNEDQAVAMALRKMLAHHSHDTRHEIKLRDKAREALAAYDAALAATSAASDMPAAPHPDTKDAERYRWLREHGDTGCTEKDGYGGQTLRMGDCLDAAIDAAMAGQGKEGDK